MGFMGCALLDCKCPDTRKCRDRSDKKHPGERKQHDWETTSGRKRKDKD